MARLDNRSTNQPINMEATEDVSSITTTDVFDTRDYDAGYTIILFSADNGSFSPGTTFTITIETSDSSSSGFSAVSDDALIGGNNDMVISSSGTPFPPLEGRVAFSRGVLDSKRFVRLNISNQTDTLNVLFVAALNGAVEVAPPLAAEGSVISV